MVIKVLISSTNPVKVRAAREAFSCFHEEISVSNLSMKEVDPEWNHFKSQPLGEDETYKNSRLRVDYIRNFNPNFDFYVGIEGGIVLKQQNQARIVVYCSVGTNSTIETVRGCEIPLPNRLFKKLASAREKKSLQLELGDLVSEISGIPNIKQKNGAVGFLTQNIVTRFDILYQSMMMALIPFLNPTLFELKVK